MAIIGICISIMLVLTLFSVISGNSFLGVSDSTGYSGSTWINGSETLVEVGDSALTFQVTELQGALLIIVVIAIAVSLLSIKFLGSGIGTVGVQTLRTSIMYGAIWGVLSVLVVELILAIYLFGGFIYIGITFAYVYGVIKQLGDSG